MLSVNPKISCFLKFWGMDVCYQSHVGSSSCFGRGCLLFTLGYSDVKIDPLIPIEYPISHYKKCVYSDKDGRVGGCWAKFPSGTHQNHNYIWNNFC